MSTTSAQKFPQVPESAHTSARRSQVPVDAHKRWPASSHISPQLPASTACTSWPASVRKCLELNTCPEVARGARLPVVCKCPQVLAHACAPPPTGACKCVAAASLSRGKCPPKGARKYAEALAHVQEGPPATARRPKSPPASARKCPAVPTKATRSEVPVRRIRQVPAKRPPEGARPQMKDRK